MVNHYHVLGYLKEVKNLGPMMQRFHGSVAKLVNDELEMRIVSFWRTRGNKDYFDGCIRDEKQLRASYQYTLLQSVRAKLMEDYRQYPHTIVDVELTVAVERAKNFGVYLEDVRYPKYEK
jgi:hypothetical protein